jgi:hypothetical protein
VDPAPAGADSASLAAAGTGPRVQPADAGLGLAGAGDPAVTGGLGALAVGPADQGGLDAIQDALDVVDTKTLAVQGAALIPFLGNNVYSSNP